MYAAAWLFGAVTSVYEAWPDTKNGLIEVLI